MTYNHLIINENGEEVLILFLNYDYEMSILKKPIKNSIISYINQNKIRFFGKKILLSVSGIVIATLIYSNNNIILDNIEDNNYNYTEYFSIIDNTPKLSSNKRENITTKSETEKKEKEPIKQNKTTNNKKTNNSTTKNTTKDVKKNEVSKKSVSEEATIKVTIYRSNDKIETLDLEDYTLGVVAAEMPASFNIEALKAQAILARTYALKSLKNGKKLTDTVSTQAYIDTDGMRKKWGSEYSKYYTKLKNAVNCTKGQYITYNNQIIDAVYHSTSNGFTEDSSEVWGYSVPYLKSVKSEWDKKTSSYERTITKSIEDVKQILELTNIDNIEIVKRNTSNRVSKVKINDNEYTGVDLRTLLSLRSTDFDIEIKDGNLIITTRGYGHGVGLSQYGANAMANNGYTYENIIKYYYSGINISKL